MKTKDVCVEGADCGGANEKSAGDGGGKGKSDSERRADKTDSRFPASGSSDSVEGGLRPPSVCSGMYMPDGGRTVPGLDPPRCIRRCGAIVCGAGGRCACADIGRGVGSALAVAR